ncbi:HlyD family secretion protein [Halomonas organivorans]|uniref:Membrane fusion protein (Multidrug efflux system) n=1 Tax=Halomonas organivorans TaxID=257772 RepID=A0A7W5BVI0_9GAMM|nr:HlyD family secretion protein [Halomonas organivorans]MBB3139403.1 membrane fusion protein (multidrug efflux system) [Halomonas organivorans]
MASPTPQAASRRLPSAPRLGLLILLVVAGLAWAGLAIHHRLTHVSAQDARVMANQVTVSSRLAGWVTDFSITEGDTLARDDRVAQLYSRPDETQLATLQAGVAARQARLDYERSRLSLAQAQFEGGQNLTHQELEASRAAMDAANARLEQARKDYERSNSLLANHSVSQQQRDEDYYTLQSAQAEYRQASREVEVSQAQADNARVGFISGSQMPLPNPDVIRAQLAVANQELAQARSRLAQQQLRLDDLRVPSPIDGVVNKTLVDEGEFIAAGQPILMMHDPDKLWVEANIKETDIGELRVGQPVDITVDAFPDDAFHGHVTVIGRAATSQFALLPDPNPSGNFTKITQRLPVRIALDDGPTELIGPGMMVEVDIDVSDQGQRHS